MRMHYLMSSLLVALLVLATTPACQKAPDAPADGEMSDAVEADWTNGTVRFVDLEGGFYGIEGEDGAKYDPTYLDSVFHQDGVRVRFQFVPMDDAISMRQWGTIVEIVDIEKVE